MAIIIEGFFDYFSKNRKEIPLETSDIERIEDLFLSYINDTNMEWIELIDDMNAIEILEDPIKDNNCYSFDMYRNSLRLQISSNESFGKIFDKYKKRLLSYGFKVKEEYKHQGPYTSGKRGVYLKNGKYLESDYLVYKYEIFISK